MNFLGGLGKPEYLSQPTQVLRRIWRGLRPLPATACVRLPWGSRLNIRPPETIGRQIWNLGVFDLAVSESLWRLAEAGETALDVGGNIGYTASILAARVRGAGQIHAFEPHPRLAQELAANAGLWAVPPHGRVTVHECALGAQPGTAWLNIPDSFEVNRGLASVSQVQAAEGLRIEVRTLDAVSADLAPVGVMKIDVEGGELAVLEGGLAALRDGRIRDIVFEDHGRMPTPAGELLLRHGYQVFALGLDGTGPLLSPAGQSATALRPWDSPSYLATRDPDRAADRFRPRGWSCLKGRLPA